MIAKYGILDITISDNGPQFSSFEFREFVKGYQITHSTISPYYAQSNGQTEHMVQTMKRLITKSHDPYVALLEYRNTKIDGIDLSPAQMFLGQRLKSIVPTTLPLLKSNINEDTLVKLKFRQEKQEENFNKHARKEPLKLLKPGDNVMMKNPSEQWTSGNIKDLHSTRRSCIVQSDGTHHRRKNRLYHFSIALFLGKFFKC
ncbi:uncharacterized protein LOC125647363 [Ostrea edulis]|uniref:uncharacterized protein LOC125647363 n=1 Tax=Ostrea edulis TaxID=37623 RepID=UPI0024AF09D5|nr:uncharacterized protein LOC125647363 [Ostrea edulis]